MSASNRWLIALDIDGTLVDHNGVATAEVTEAIARAQAAGHHVMLATGRPFRGALPVAQQLGITGQYVVASNGAMVMELLGADAGGADAVRVAGGSFSSHVERGGDAGELKSTPYTRLPGGVVRIVDTDHGDVRYRVVEHRTFDPAPVLERIAPHFADAKYAVEDGDDGYRFNNLFVLGTFGAPVQQVSFAELSSGPVSRVVVVSPEDDNADFQEIVAGIGLHQVTYAVGWSSWLDIAPLGVTKASALEGVRQRLGIAPNRVLTIGDGFNDVEMIEWAAAGGGLGVAMGHGREVLRERASAVVGDLEHNGVAEAISLVLDR